MKTTIHNHLRGQNGCLGFYYGLASLLSAYPEGGLPGEFFINGETQSIWIWDSTGRSWYDTNHAAPSPFMGIITEPATFSPAVESGVQACFIYVAGGKGAYVFPAYLKGSAAIDRDDRLVGNSHPCVGRNGMAELCDSIDVRRCCASCLSLPRDVESIFHLSMYRWSRRCGLFYG